MSAPIHVNAGPFDLRPETGGGDTAVLCLHGLTGTPYEVRPIGEALFGQGVRAVGPLLPGHGSKVEDLASLRFGDWVEAVARAYRRLADQHTRVHVVGMSLGGLLALHLASHEPVASVVSIGAPLRFRQPLPFLIPLAKRIRPLLEKRTGSDIRDPAARARHPGYRQMPLNSVHELIRLQAVLTPRLGAIASPAFIAHGAHDTTAAPRDAHFIHGALGSQRKRLSLYADSAHIVPVDRDGEALVRDVADFVLGGE